MSDRAEGRDGGGDEQPAMTASTIAAPIVTARERMPGW
jgi:hypothetical protein